MVIEANFPWGHRRAPTLPAQLVRWAGPESERGPILATVVHARPVEATDAMHLLGIPDELHARLATQHLPDAALRGDPLRAELAATNACDGAGAIPGRLDPIPAATPDIEATTYQLTWALPWLAHLRGIWSN